MTTITHPTLYTISGMKFQVTARIALTEQQAQRVALHFYRTHKFKKKDQGKLFVVATLFDQETIGLI